MLYGSVVLNSVEQCSLTLGMLSRRGDIARHVRELVIRPQGRNIENLSPLERDIAASAVIQAVGSMSLDALVKFVWDADELPLHDDIWFALRIG